MVLCKREIILGVGREVVGSIVAEQRHGRAHRHDPVRGTHPPLVLGVAVTHVVVRGLVLHRHIPRRRLRFDQLGFDHSLLEIGWEVGA